jgi:predicted transcriptional regulator
VSGDEKLTESVRVRLTPTEKAELDRLAVGEDRSASAVARRGVRHELERLRKSSRGRS